MTLADSEIAIKHGSKDEVSLSTFDAFRSPKWYKVLCILVMLIYSVGGFWLSRIQIVFLDNFTRAITPNVLSRATELSINFLANNFSHFQLATVWSICIHQSVYWSLCCPDMFYQFIPFMKRFKIQKKRTVPFNMQWECFCLVCFNQWVIESPLFVFNYVFAEAMGYGFTYNTLPSWYQLIGMMIGCLALEDTWHYFMHSLVHRGLLYQKIHKLHHRFTVPIGMQAEYAHPLEVMLLGIGFTLGCGVYCNHFFATWLWMSVRLMETVEVHSGFDFPQFLNIFQFLPFYGGPRFHDFHHSNFVGNYSSTFTYWDSIFDTDIQFKYFEKKRLESEKLKDS